MFLIRLKKTTAYVVLLFHFDFLSGTDTVTLDAVQFAQFLNGCSVACCYFRKGITILDGYTLVALFSVSASLAALLAALLAA